MAYGLCDLCFGKPSFARIRLSDLGAVVGPAKKPVCRDRYFRPTRPLWDYAYHSFMDGPIPDSAVGRPKFRRAASTRSRSLATRGHRSRWRLISSGSAVFARRVPEGLREMLSGSNSSASEMPRQ